MRCYMLYGLPGGMSMPKAAECLLTIPEVAQWLGFHPEHVRRLARQGALPAMKAGRGRGSWRFSRAEVEAWLKRERSRREGRCG